MLLILSMIVVLVVVLDRVDPPVRAVLVAAPRPAAHARVVLRDGGRRVLKLGDRPVLRVVVQAQTVVVESVLRLVDTHRFERLQRALHPTVVVVPTY